jgi:hypothetical protein
MLTSRPKKGWGVCASGDCIQDTSWHRTDAAVNVTAFQRFADTAYDRQNASILSIEKISAGSIVAIDPGDFRKYHDIILAPTPAVLNQSDGLFADKAAGFVVQLVLQGLLATYKTQFGLYPNGALDLLKGFLAVPFQFNTLLLEMLAPTSVPANLETVARLQRSAYRAIASPWNVYLFAALAFVMLAWSLGCLTCVCFWLPASPNGSAFPEIDLVSKAACGRGACGACHVGGPAPARVVLPDGKCIRIVVEPEPLEDLGKLTRSMGLGNGMSGAVLAGIKDKRAYCGAYTGGSGGDGNRQDEMVVIVTGRDRDKLKTLKKGGSYY